MKVPPLFFPVGSTCWLISMLNICTHAWCHLNLQDKVYFGFKESFWCHSFTHSNIFHSISMVPNFFKIYIYKEKICFIYLAELQTGRMFKRKKCLCSDLWEITSNTDSPLGIFLMKWNHVETELPPRVPCLACECCHNSRHSSLGAKASTRVYCRGEVQNICWVSQDFLYYARDLKTQKKICPSSKSQGTPH